MAGSSREPGIQASERSIAAVSIYRLVHLDSGFAAARRPGMMVWTAPDGIISAKLVVLIRNSKGDRP